MNVEPPSQREDGTLWAWGSNAYGQLGAAPSRNAHNKEASPPEWDEPKPIPADNLEGRRVVQVACGLYHTVCLTADGLVYTWGRNFEFQLGRSGEEGIPLRVGALADIPVQQIACGRYHTAVLTTGAIMEWGWSSVKEPRVVEQLLGMSIAQLACGVYTTIALTTAGQVYTWETKQLGTKSYAPQLVEALANRGVVKLACGMWDVMALTEEGEVYTWSDHSWSPYNTNRVTPTLVTALSGQGITDIVCGKNISMALTDGGDVWWWPKGKEEEAQVMEQLSDKGVRALSCGDTHFVALATVGWKDDCTLFTSGKNDYSQLGRLQKKIVEDQTAQPVSKLEKMSFCQVACGGYHTVALTGPWAGLSSDLTNDLAAALHSGQMADLEIVVGDRSFLAHKIVLAARCQRLSLDEDTSAARTRIVLQDTDPDIFSAFLEFIYQDRCRVAEKNGSGLLSLAERFGVPRLARLCSSYARTKAGSPDIKRIGEELLEVLNTPRFSDISFVDGDTRMRAHKAIVAARCPYFKALWTVGMRESEDSELPVSDVGAEVFMEVLRYIYSGTVSFNPDTVIELMAAANQYQLVQLKRRCERYIIQAIDADNVESLREAGELYDAPLLASCCQRFMQQNRPRKIARKSARG